MKTISRYIMTLVALFAMTAGAWAIGISCSPSYIGRVICTDGSIFVSSTEAAAEGKTAVAVIAYVNTVNKTGLALALTNQGQMNWENAKTSCADKNTSTPVTGGTWKLPSQSEWSQMIQGLGGYTAMNNVFASFGGDNLTNNYWSSTPNGNDKAVYYRSSNGGWGATSRTQNAVFVRACLEFNINLFISDDMTEATFAMPAYDATAEYELVRDMEIEVAAVVTRRIRIKKNEQDEFELVKPEQIVPEVTDGIESKTMTDDTDYTLQLQKLDESSQEEKWDDATTDDLSVGTYRYVVTGKTLYEGEITTNTFVLFVGYEVEVPAGEYITYYRDENLYVEDEKAKLYTVTAVSEDDGKATATELKVTAANTPILVKNNDTETRIILLIPTDDAADDVKAYEGFKSTLVETVISASDEIQNNYALNGLQFVWVKDALSVGANKAWLEIPTPSVDAARTLTIVFDDETTSVSEELRVKGDESADAWYDLNGRKLNGIPTRKGVYVKNGKKVVIK